MTSGDAEANRKLAEALTCLEADDVEGAIELTELSGGLASGNSLAVHVLALVAIKMGELLRAEELLRVAHDMAPNLLDHTEVLSIVSARLERMHDALYFGKLGSVLQPSKDLAGLVPDWLGTFEDAMQKIERSDRIEEGRRLMERGRYTAAVQEYQTAVEATPSDQRGWRGLRDALFAEGRAVEALFAAQAISSGKGEVEPEDLSVAARVLTRLGRFEEARDCHIEAVQMRPNHSGIRAAMIDDLMIMPDVDQVEIQRAERLWEGSFGREFESDTARYSDGPLRVGVLSGSLAGHRGVDLVWPLLTAGRGSDYQVYVYSNTIGEDALSRRIRSDTDRWTDISTIDDATVALIIRNDEVHVLIDLDGYANSGRREVSARRPAKVMVDWFGTPDSSEGIFDYHVTNDGLVDRTGACVAPLTALVSPPAEAKLVAPFPRYPGAPMRIGFAIALRKYSNQLLEALKALCESNESIELVILPVAMGGVSALDDLEPRLDHYKLLDRVTYPPDAADLHTALGNFLDACDIVVDPGPDPDMTVLWEATSRSKPVFALSSGPGRNHGGSSFVKLCNEEPMASGDLEGLLTAIREVAADAAKYDASAQFVFNTLSAAVSQNAVKESGSTFSAAMKVIAIKGAADG